MAACVKLAKAGWPEGAARFTQYADAFAPHLENKRRRIAGADVFGDELNPVAYAQGARNVFDVYTKKPRVKRMHNLVVNTGRPHYVGTESAIRFFAGLAGFLRGLEETGHSVAVTVASSNRTGSESVPVIEWRLLVKAHGERMHDSLLAFWLCHPAVLRRLGFAVRETLIPWNDGGRAHSQDYGFTQAVTTEGDEVATPLLNKSTLEQFDASPAQYWPEWWAARMK